MDECLAKLAELTSNPLALDGNAVPLLRRIRSLLEASGSGCSSSKGDDDEIGLELHRLTRVAISGQAAAEYYSRIWAAPGMVDFLLNEPLVTCGALQRRHKYPEGYDYDLLPPPAREEIDGWDTDLSAHHFCYFVFNILVRTAVDSGQSACGVHDGYGTLRHVQPFQVCCSRVL
jgi:hypothetical protein